MFSLFILLGELSRTCRATVAAGAHDTLDRLEREGRREEHDDFYVVAGFWVSGCPSAYWCCCCLFILDDANRQPVSAPEKQQAHSHFVRPLL